MFLISLAKYSKLLFTIVVLFIVLQLYYTIQFARLSLFVDYGKPTPHPIAFEAFPFVVYNMYSGKMIDWHNYNYYRIEADDVPLATTDIHFFESEQLLNPLDKFLLYEADSFNQEPLHSFLLCRYNTPGYANKIYNSVSNHGTANCHNEWGRWLLDYISAIKGSNVHQVKIYSCHYQYNEKGRPEKIDEKQVFQYP
jgi:hypothetical protein